MWQIRTIRDKEIHSKIFFVENICNLMFETRRNSEIAT